MEFFCLIIGIDILISHRVLQKELFITMGMLDEQTGDRKHL